MREILSKRERELPEAMMADIIRIAAEGKDLISLGPGEPDFTTPKHIIDFAKQKLDEGFTHYSSPQGMHSLREAISKKLRRENKVLAKPEEIIVTSGSTESIMLALMSLVDVGEEVLIQDPGFLSYRPTVDLMDAYPVSVRLKHEEGFALSRERLEEATMDPKKVKVLILNSPSNPTGVVYDRKLLQEIAGFAKEHDIFVISDEAYEKFVYGKKHVSIASFKGMKERTLTLQTFSKSYAMPGWRVGYAAGPKKLIDAMSDMHVYSSICAPTVSQLAALKALTGPQKCVEDMRKEYDRRRKLIVKRLNEIEGFECAEPTGAFYAFPSIEQFGMKSMEFCKWLIREAHVITVPGSEFGRYGEGFIRMSYATAYEKIEKALDRIEKAVKRLK